MQALLLQMRSTATRQLANQTIEQLLDCTYICLSVVKPKSVYYFRLIFKKKIIMVCMLSHLYIFARKKSIKYNVDERERERWSMCFYLVNKPPTSNTNCQPTYQPPPPHPHSPFIPSASYFTYVLFFRIWLPLHSPHIYISLMNKHTHRHRCGVGAAALAMDWGWLAG